MKITAAMLSETFIVIPHCGCPDCGDAALTIQRLIGTDEFALEWNRMYLAAMIADGLSAVMPWDVED